MKNEILNSSGSFDSSSSGLHEEGPLAVPPSELGPGEITVLLEDLDNDEAATALWHHFFPKLVGYAEQKMRDMPSKARDEEDVALSAMHSFFEIADMQRYDLKSRDELWRLLVTITFRKITGEKRRQYAQKRGGGVAHIGNHVAADGRDPIDNIADSSQMPEFVEDVYAQCNELLNVLPSESLRYTAQMKLEGCSNSEISDTLRCSLDETKSRLKKIREIWRRQMDAQD